MSELIKKEISLSIGREVLIFLKNGFRFEGLIVDCDKEFIHIKDAKKGSDKFAKIDEISEIEIR